MMDATNIDGTELERLIMSHPLVQESCEMFTRGNVRDAWLRYHHCAPLTLIRLIQADPSAAFWITRSSEGNIAVAMACDHDDYPSMRGARIDFFMVQFD